ncbi:RND superfamily putative drug exporter [Kibdelosporangium banguiense]|uniref:RND superfamily putative drug exporter n=1 Tax=Kibdelosporangium banguiense TaxID=1365924 RepID=A0ABS4TNV3_9PSEU|nr:MMPL family transporter [Kibdelosporangium banguiense]MBP2326082.1 RND superfamily putative drug exporter [Kibdelosporangium banguiense]
MHVDAPTRVPPVSQQTRSTRRWLPAVVLLLWLALGAAGSSMPGALSQVQRNDGESFLPADAEATEVVRLQEKIAGGKIQPALVVFARPAGLTEADAAAVVARRTEISHLAGLSGPPSDPVPAQDGKAVLVSVPVSGVDGFETGRIVQRMRVVAGSFLPDGLSVHVTGPAGYTADFGEALAGIDGRLLVVTALVVALVLVLVYRSPLLPIVVLVSAGLALVLASLAVYPLASGGVLTLNGQSQGILFILVFGASTDYALLLIARHREETARAVSPRQSVAAALRASFESIVASAGTVILGLTCLLLSQLSSNKGLGPVAAIGIAASLLVSLTFLPAALVLLGRAAFWPLAPRPSARPRLWGRISDLVGRRFIPVWVMSVELLVLLTIFLGALRSSGVEQTEIFLDRPDAVAGQQVLAGHFPAGAGEPIVIITDTRSVAKVAEAAKVDGVAAVKVGEPSEGFVPIEATLTSAADSGAARQALADLRTAVREVPGAFVRVGGQTAIWQEIEQAAERDRQVIIPAVLLVVFLVLVLLLRSLLAPLVLIGTVVLSFTATLGVGALVFNEVLEFPGSDPSVPLYAFVFLVALGVDYNIFLMTRVREESQRLGTRAGTLRGLTVTGGVITSAGVVLAATFAALAVLPILFMAQIAFLVAFGVLLDTLLVRSLLVPALTIHIGRDIWWPGRLRRGAI